MIEILIWIIIGALSIGMGVITIKSLDPSFVEPHALKAYIFSRIMDSRYTGRKVRVDNDGVSYMGIVRHFPVKLIVSSERGEISYKGSRIISAGTVYLDKGSVSFLPVTGKMVVNTK